MFYMHFAASTKATIKAAILFYINNNNINNSGGIGDCNHSANYILYSGAL